MVASVTLKTRVGVLALACTAQVVDVLDGNAVLVALPVIGRDLDLRAAELQWVVTAYVLVFAGCLLAAGRAADALGRRRVFAAGVTLFTAASLACGLAPSSGWLIAARAVQGLGAALTAPAALAMVVDAFPAGGGRDRAVAVWTGAAAVAGATGLVLGGLIAAGPGWRWIFLVNVPIGLAALAATPRVAPAAAATGASSVRELDLPGAAAATAGLALLVLGASREAPIAFAGAVLAFGAFAARERRAARPVLPPRLAGERRVVLAAATGAVLTATTSGGGVLATLRLQEALGLGPARAALVLLPLSLAVAAGSVAAGRTRRPLGHVVRTGLALVAGGSIVASLAPTTAGLVGWAVLAGAGLGAASVAATSIGTSAVDGDDRGTVAGLLSTAAQAGTALGVAGLVLVAASATPAAAYAVAAALAVAALAISTPATAAREAAP